MPEDAEKPAGRKFNIGDIVLDRDGDEESSAYVTTLPDATAEEWVAYENEGEEITVAEDNPEYPADAPVVVVVHGTSVHFDLPDWNRYTPLSVEELEDVDTDYPLYYAFPAPRLVRDQKRPHGPEAQRDRAESGGEGDESATEKASASDGETAEPSAAVVALSRFLNSDGMDATIADDGQSVRVSKADDSYRVSLAGVEGDGPQRSQLEQAVEKVRAAPQATTE
jgi:hypothetical protein